MRSAGGRLALALAVVLAAAAVIAVALVAMGSSSGEDTAAAAPEECLELWNGDPDALGYARHNATFHRYDEAQVGYLSAETGGEAVASQPGGGECAVVFARGDLDPEIVAAGQIYRDGAWLPLSEVVGLEELTALQRTALEGANAEPAPTGELEPL